MSNGRIHPRHDNDSMAQVAPSPEMTEVVVDNGEKLQGTVGDVDGSIASEMMEFFRAPVAGGNPITSLQ